MITALCFIQVAPDSINEAGQAIADIYGVSKIPRVIPTQTHVSLRTYSQRDIDARLSIGNSSSFLVVRRGGSIGIEGGCR
jgi:hypothetical protein